MYQIKCDNYVIYDPRDDEEKLIVGNPKCKLEVNTVGSASFNIYAKHPHYDKLQKLRSVFEISQDGNVIFRGRMTDDSRDFDNMKAIDIEGAMAFFNDSIVRPFAFPEDFEGTEAYETARQSGNVVEFFLNWLIQNHNSQVEEFQQFKLGNVTVRDANNYISYSNSDYEKTWATLESKLFKGSLGGYLCIRYEDDGNYIDYVSDFEFTNVQRIEYGKNLLDIKTESNAAETYSAVLPLGMKIKDIVEGSDDESRLTISALPDGKVNDDIYKSGDTLYSKSAVEKYGFIYAPTSETTFEDVSLADNLQDRGIEYLMNKGIMLKNTITINAVDLHFTDDEIAAFRIYRNVLVYSKPHEHEGTYKLTKLDIDIMNPQNTKITLGDTTQTLTDINNNIKHNLVNTVQTIKIVTDNQQVDITDLQNSITSQSTSLVNTCESIILEATETLAQTADLESFKETVQAQLKVLADSITLNMTAIADRIENVDGDLQEKFNMITKYFTFDINGLTIGQADNPYKAIIDNDRFGMFVNGVEVLWLDAEGKAHIPEVEVTKKFNLFGYMIEEDENGNVNCEYVGGDA